MSFLKMKFLSIFGDYKPSPLEFLALLYVCGRFYYLMGFIGHLKPTAPLPFIFIKDVILGIIVFSFFLVPKANPPKFLKTLLYIWIVSFTAITCVHFFAKSFSDWGQHYVRNVLLVLATTPALYRWSASPKLFDLNNFLFWTCSINIIVAILQEWLLPETMLGQSRPLGLVGDPISLTAIVLIFVALILLKEISYFRIAILTLITGYVLNMSASISACLSAAIAAVATMIFLYKHLDKNQFKKLLIKITLCTCLLIASFTVPHKKQYDNLTERIKVLYLSHFRHRQSQSKVDDLLYDSLKNGRAQSLEITKEAISSEKIEHNLLAFWVGQYQSTLYRRVDSTPAVLIINWGLGIFILFYSTLLFIMIFWSKKFILDKNKITDKKINTNAISIYIFTLLIVLSFFNSVIYRSPLNFFLILTSTTLLLSTWQNRKSQNES